MFLFLFLIIFCAVIPPPTGVIVLVDNTPEVIPVAGGTSANLRVQFTRGVVGATYSCVLEGLSPEQDCKSRLGVI